MSVKPIHHLLAYVSVWVQKCRGVGPRVARLKMFGVDI